MAKNKRMAILLVLVLAFMTIVPSMTLAAGYLNSSTITDLDSYYIVGDNAINLNLQDQLNNPYSGSVTARISDPNGVVSSYSSSGQQGNYTISNVSLATPGNYSIVVSAVYSSNWYSAYTGIYVLDANISISGSIVLNDSNPNHQVIATLRDSNSKVIPRKTLTVDASTVGGASKDFITDSNGQIKFNMSQISPTMLGNVNFLHHGHLLGTQAVQPAYTTGGRIGDNTSGNAALSVEVARRGWTSATNVILTRDDILVDAMTAVPLSKKFNAPILMTPSSGLDSSVLQKIQQLQAKNVYIVGGVVAVTPAVEETLTDNGFNVIRLAGYDRYETAVKIAQLVGSKGTVYLVNGYGEPDALAVSAFAANQGNPILLTERDNIPDVTLAQLQALAPTNVTIIGGTAVVSNNIESQLKAQYAVQRWGGWDRYGTQLIVFRNLFTNQSPLYFASALVEPSDVSGRNPNGDALLTAALAAKMNGFVVAVPPDNLPSTLATFLLYNKGYIPTATVVGNRTSITSNLEQYLQLLLNR